MGPELLPRASGWKPRAVIQIAVLRWWQAPVVAVARSRDL